MYPDKVLEIVSNFIQDDEYVLADPHAVAEALTRQAEELSHKRGYVSPFAKNARENRYDYPGGKPDDITVIVSQIV